MKIGVLVCDFCHLPNVRWEYPAQSFTFEMATGMPLLESKSSWLACDLCRPLIDGKLWDHLKVRVLKTDPIAKEIPRQHLGRFMTMVRQCWEIFSDLRTSAEPLPVRTEQYAVKRGDGAQLTPYETKLQGLVNSGAVHKGNAHEIHVVHQQSCPFPFGAGICNCSPDLYDAERRRLA